MYALIENNVAVQWPFELDSLRKTNPEVSFPKSFEDFDFTEFGVVQVEEAPVPNYDPNTQKLTEEAPVEVSGKWTRTFVVSDLSAEEVQQLTDSKARAIRFERNTKLADTDWRVTYEVEKAAVDGLGIQFPLNWATYRQALRDITSQPGFPHNVTWPEEPTI